MADPEGTLAYVRGVTAPLEAVSLETGRLAWSVTVPARWLAWTDRGVALLEGGTVALRSPADGRLVWRSAPLAGLGGAAVMDGGSERTWYGFTAEARVAGDRLEAGWTTRLSRVYGFARPAEPEERRGSFAVGLADGRLLALPAPIFGPPDPEPGPRVAALAGALGDITNINPVIIGPEFVAVVRRHAEGPVLLHRWTLPAGEPLPVVTLDVPPGGTGLVVAAASADRRSVAVSWQQPSVRPMTWDIVEIATARRTGRLTSPGVWIEFGACAGGFVVAERRGGNGEPATAWLEGRTVRDRPRWRHPVWTLPSFPPVP